MDSRFLLTPASPLANPASPWSAAKAPIIRLDQATRFSYWHNGSIREGLTCFGELFRVAVEFDRASRLEAMKMADGLRRSGVPSLVTIAEETFTVWVSLRHAPDGPESC